MAVPAIRDQFALARKNSLAQLNGRIVTIAKQANAAIMNLEPRPAGFVRTVDGIAGAQEEAVKPNGLIVYDYQRLDLVVAFALDTLRMLSPKKSGAYVEAHTVFINGRAAQPPYVISARDDVAISNPEPYARKIEIGRMQMRIPGTDHVYQQAQQVVARAWANLVNVEFTWRSLSLKTGSPLIVSKKKGRTGEHALQSQPALVFTLK